LSVFIDEGLTTAGALYGTATSRSATAVTDAPNLANTNWTAAKFRGFWMHIPLETAVNAVRPMTTLTTAGVLTQGGVNWTTTTQLYYRLTPKNWHPTRDLVPLANRALEKAWQWWRTPLTMVPDGDMQAVSAWAATNTTATKSTTRAWGAAIKSQRCVNTAANGGVTSASFEMEAGRAFRFTAKAFAAVGTPFIAVYDSSGTLVPSATVTASPAVLNTWQELSCVGTMPYTSKGGTASVGLGGVESNADIYWGEATLVPELLTRFTLPAWVTQWRTEQGEEALRLYRSRNRQGTIGSWPARSYDLELIDPSEYQILQAPSSLNPIEIEWARGGFYTGFPIFVEARRPYLDFGAVSADADTSGITLRHWVAAMKDLAARERNLTTYLPVWEADFVREQKRNTSQLKSPAPDGRGMAWTSIS